MCLRTRLGLIVVAVVTMVCSACEEADLFVENGTLSSAMGAGLTFQGSNIHGNQIMSWVFEVVEIQVPDQDVFTYLEIQPCEYIQNLAFFTALDTQCGVRGYVLDEGIYTSTMRVTVSEIRVYRASRPPLPDGGDFDMDMVVNEVDNCQLIPNPMQEDINMDGFGDACSLNDPNTGAPVFPDRDGDTIADFSDNCVWVPNTMQDDMDEGTLLRGIGDACQEEADVMLPQVPTVFNFDADIPIANGNITFMLVDFSSDPSDPDAPVTCDPALTMCVLNDALVEARPI